MSHSPKIGKSVAKMFAAVLLAGAATGCSSDATRFGSLFGSSPDPMTTASIGRSNGYNQQAPVPQGTVGGYGYQQPAQNAYPQQPNPNYGYNNVQPSPARVASSATVQRNDLAPPSASASQDVTTRREALAQPMPVANSNINPDNITTGSVRALDNGWHTDGAATVRLAPGESIGVLSARYGVPEKALLQANGLTSSSQARAGQQIIIPRFGRVQNASRVAGSASDLTRNQVPVPQREQEQKVAVLPTQNALRDKAASDAGKVVPPSGNGAAGGYKVKAGDSLSKIARENGVSVAALKAANGLTNEGVRIGQVLRIPAATPTAADPVQTASIKTPAPAAAAAPAAQPVPAKVAQAPAPAVEKTVTVADVQKQSDVASLAPESTGISKYRWPVRGAVINGFGDNVDGTRSDGIRISVPEGTPIKAAENGVVIYAGNGLKQLGNTVLVRHDDGKVTVYGNASKLEVQRGQKVQRGQTVAISGMSGNAKRPQVHFEVRQDARPVNPTSFLE